MAFAPGQRWTYRAPLGHEHSRLVIGAVVMFEDRDSIICCSVTETPRRQPDGTVQSVGIPFIPMSEPAFRASVASLDGAEEPPPQFADELDQWSRDPRGLSVFTVAFEGSLDHMIAQQMAEIVRKSAA
jgi:hypothetical protein